MAIGLVEWLNEICPALRRSDGPDKVVVGALEAASRHDFGGVGVDGPAHKHVNNVASTNPGDHEGAEKYIAEGGVTAVLETFGKLGGQLCSFGLDEVGSLQEGKGRRHP